MFTKSVLVFVLVLLVLVSSVAIGATCSQPCKEISCVMSSASTCYLFVGLGLNGAGAPTCLSGVYNTASTNYLSCISTTGDEWTEYSCGSSCTPRCDNNPYPEEGSCPAQSDCLWNGVTGNQMQCAPA